LTKVNVSAAYAASYQVDFSFITASPKDLSNTLKIEITNQLRLVILTVNQDLALHQILRCCKVEPCEYD
jgi:hypothetical protein